MTDSFRVAPNEWECLVFIALAENRGAEAAAQALTRQRGQTYQRQSVEKIHRKLEEWVGAPLLERRVDRKLYLTQRGEDFLESARSVVAQYRLMRRPAADQALPTLACLPHHTHFVSLAEDILFDEQPRGSEKMAVEYLPQRYRGDTSFRDHAKVQLECGNYQLILGPRVEDKPRAFDFTKLYSTQLEAMVGKHYSNDAVPVAELVRRHRLFLPPGDLGSRNLLEERIGTTLAGKNPCRIRVAAETYETATSVMRIRNEQHRRGTTDSRVVVEPSDVALAFKEGMEFGGRNAERFKWIPITHRAEDGSDEPIRTDVCVTVRRGNFPALERIVAALQEAVHRLNNSSRHGGLCGQPPRRQGLSH